MALLLNWRIWVALALAGVLAFTHLTAYRAGSHAVQAKWDESNVKQERAADAQAERNREIQQAAEKKYVVEGQTRDHYITQTIQEIVHEAAPLSACPVPEPVRVRLNALATCAASDSAASCGTAGNVPQAGTPAGHGDSQ